MSAPWDLEKNRPATGFSPCSSKNPTSTGPSLTVCIERSRLTKTVLLLAAPIAITVAQETPFTP